MRSYLAGRWSQRGWWSFYLYALSIKVPLGVLLLAAMAVVFSWAGPKAGFSRDELFVVLPPVTILLLVSAQTGFTIHFRYVLAVLPFAFIWASKAALAARDRASYAVACAAGVAWAIGGSLWVYPHSLSYFNELAGGPQHGAEYLLDSGIAWGQDLLYLKRWHEQHERPEPLFVAAFGFISPKMVGIDCSVPPSVPRKLRSSDRPDANQLQPGWYIVDVNYLHGSEKLIPTGDGQFVAPPLDGFWYLDDLPPVDRIGYSMLVYHLTPEDLRRIRARREGSPSDSPTGGKQNTAR
jgi:hypothetical protein